VKQILIVENDTMVRENLVELLEMENFVTLSTTNGLAGLEMAQRYLPDLIICDIVLAGLDGYSILSALRKNILTATIPFIFLTARAAQSDFHRGMSLGADDYLVKPYTTEDLLNAVRSRGREKLYPITKRYNRSIFDQQKVLVPYL
jgi:DNA-binding response OmpR family regulator